MKHFKLLTPQGEVFDSKKYQGESNLLLVFYRGTWCGFCKRQIMDLNKNYNKFKNLKTKIVAISNDSQLNTSLLSTLIRSKFPLLSDNKNKVLNLYKIKIEQKTVKPTLYLFSGRGDMLYSHISAFNQERLGTEEILNNISKKPKRKV